MARGAAAGVLVGDGQGTWAALQVEGLEPEPVEGEEGGAASNTGCAQWLKDRSPLGSTFSHPLYTVIGEAELFPVSG